MSKRREIQPRATPTTLSAQQEFNGTLNPIYTLESCENWVHYLLPEGLKPVKMLRSCGACHKRVQDVKLLACGGCWGLFQKTPYATYYCSQKCQSTHWATHKAVCTRLSARWRTLDPSSASTKQIRKRILDSTRTMRANIIPLAWAAYQAVRQNPQYNPLTTYLHIQLEKIQIGTFEIPSFPVRFRFLPLTPDLIMPNKDDCASHGHLGYWGTDEYGVSPINVFLFQMGFVNRPTPQWPYILAKILAANESKLKNVLTYMIYLLQAVDGQRHSEGLKHYAAPGFESTWAMDVDKFCEWMYFTRNIMPS